MTTQVYLIAYGLYLLTLVLSFLIVSVPYYQAKWENTGQRFDFKKFWQSSWNVNIANPIIGFICLFLADVILVNVFKVAITPHYVYVFMVILGAFGAPAVIKKWGRAQKYFDDFVDKKLPVDGEGKKP